MQRLIEEAKANWQALNKGEQALARAAINAKDEGLRVPTLGLGLHTIWDYETAEIVLAAKKWSIDTVLYAGGQSGSVNTLGLFIEAGAAVGSMQKLTLRSTDFEIIDGEVVTTQKSVWAFEINIY